MEPARYLATLRNRMVEPGFTLDDPLFRKVYLAQATEQDLINELHAKAYIARFSSNSDKPR